MADIGGNSTPVVFVMVVLVSAGLSACRNAGDSGDTPVEQLPTDLAVGSPTPELKERLEALGYVTETPIAEDHIGKDGVTHHLVERAYAGLNVYCSENSTTVKFVGMRGHLVHQVILPVGSTKHKTNLCKTVDFWPDGSFVMVVEGTKLIKSDLRGRVLWELDGSYHHDVDVAPDGSVVAIRNVQRRSLPINPDGDILDDLFVKISPDGEVLDQISLAEMVTDVPPLLSRARSLARHVAPWEQGKRFREDVFHTNSVQVLHRDVPRRDGPGLEQGQVLFCSRYLNAIGVVSWESKRIVWHWGKRQLQWPHHPTLQENGSLLVYDNGIRRRFSRVLRIDPFSSRIQWKYRAPKRSDFFDSSRGAAYGLPNDNVLITESTKGHVFEVDPDGQIVWEFWNPDRSAEKDKRATIFRMQRLHKAQFSEWPILEKFAKTLPDG